MNDVSSVSAPRQPLPHSLAWHVAEFGLRGNSHLAGLLRRLSAPTTGLVTLPSGQVLFHDPADYVASNIYRGGYERAERWIFGQLIRRSSTVVDVGANVGIYTMTAARLVGPTGRVFAVEPGPALAKLRVAVEVAGWTNVTVVPFAMDREEGEAVMHVPAHQAGLASLRDSCDRTDGRPVDVMRLDALPGVPPGDIDVLKIDTEGYEEKVLAGAAGWLEARRVRSILLEVSPDFGDVGFVGKAALAHGFAIFKIGYSGGLRYRPTVAEVSALDVQNEPVQANYLLIRSDLVRILPFAHVKRDE